MNSFSDSPDAGLVNIARGAAIGVLQSGLDGRIQYANQRLLGMLGYASEALLGKTIQEITHPEDLHLTLEKLELVRQGHEDCVFEKRYLRQDGSVLFATTSGAPLRDEAGRITAMVGFVVDRTTQHLTEKALQASEERLNRALHIGGLNAWEWHLDTDEVTLSSNGTDFWGRTVGSADEFRGVIHPEDRAKVQEAFRGALSRGADQVEASYRLSPVNSRERWVYSKGEVLRGPDGKPTRLMGMTVDITERREATEATLLLADAGQILGSSLDYQTTLTQLADVLVPRFADWYAVDLLNDEGQLQRVSVSHRDPSKVALAMELDAKYPPKRDVPRGIYHVIATGTPDWSEHIPDELLVQAAHDSNHLLLLRDLRLQSFICVPLRARGKAIGAMTLVYAESERRYRESDLRLAMDIAGRAASAVDNARLFSTLQLADRRKDEFLAMLAHELRNPLAPITTAAALLSKNHAQDERVARMAEVIGRQVTHMTELIDDLLDVSRVTRGLIKLEKEPVDIKAVVTAAIEQAQPLIDQRRHTLARILASEPMIVAGDRARLIQAIANLLTNAAKYTPPGGRIELCANVEADHIHIAVSDNGVGIEKSMLTQVFELFVQASRTPDRAQGGLGIGLALVRSMVRLHGGDVRAHSAGEGRGSTFTITLPRAMTTPATDLHSSRTAGMPRGRLSIAIVDDNHDAADVLAEVLRLHGHEVRTLPTSAAALELGVEALPDLFILDIGLPDIDGFTLARRLKSMPGGEALTLLALTGYGQPEDRQRALDAGFLEHMVKPPDIDRLVRFIDTEVRARRAGQGDAR